MIDNEGLLNSEGNSKKRDSSASGDDSDGEVTELKKSKSN
jgi:hypothetical protein